MAGKAISPIDAARYVNKERAELKGVIPGSVSKGVAMPLSEAELLELYETNISVDKDEEAENERGLPDPTSLMAPGDFESILEFERKNDARINQIAEAQNWFVSVDAEEATFTIAFSDGTFTLVSGFTADSLGRLADALNEHGTFEDWEVQAVADGKKGASYRARWNNLVEQIEQAEALASSYLTETVGVDVVLLDEEALREGRDDLATARGMLSRKGKIGTLAKMRNKNLESVLELVSIDGKAASTARDCDLALKLLDVVDSRDSARKAWTSLMESQGAPAFDTLDDSEPERIAKNWVGKIEYALDWYGSERQRICSLMESCGLDEQDILRESPLDNEEADVARTLHALDEVLPALIEIAGNVLEKEAMRARKRRARDLLRNAANSGSRIVESLLEAFEAEDVSEYRAKYARLLDLVQKKSTLLRRFELLSRLSASAPEWASLIRRREGAFGAGTAPERVLDAWNWLQYAQALRELNDIDVMELESKSASLSVLYRSKTAELAEVRAWRHLLANTGQDITLKQALEGWKQTMKRIGKGTGKRAPRLKAQARDMMAKCQKAVPAWIMPMSKALESLNPATNRFDVVIVDEASQSDVTALAVTFMARKIIIVGDDKQVSPMAVGVDQDKADNLADIYIKDKIPNYHLYGPKTSLYDIAATTFRPLMLQEH